ncbi:MAG: hypothetical protein C0490_11515 [Marivirga sp.]|nr:hypothetical protein [Marivirga sp.]
MDKSIDKHAILFWLPSLCFLLHTIEELPLFATWVSKHFKPYSTEFFALTHIPLFWLVLHSSFYAATTDKAIWKILASSSQVQFGVNAIFHLSTSAIFNEYSPGMFTAAAINLPVTIFFLKCIIDERQLTSRQCIYRSYGRVTGHWLAV